MEILEADTSEADSILISGEPTLKVFDVSHMVKAADPRINYVIGAPSPSDMRRLSKGKHTMLLVFVPMRSAIRVRHAALTQTLNFKNAYYMQQRLAIIAMPIDPINKGYQSACANIIEDYYRNSLPQGWYAPGTL